MNKIAHDFIFTNHLSLLISSTNRSIYSLLDRFCVRILPEIHDKIKWFDLESFSMERILLAANDLNLSSLRLYNIRQKQLYIFSLVKYFTSILSMINTLKLYHLKCFHN